MKHIFPILILITFLIFNGCSKEKDPVACFTNSANGSEVSFNSGCSERASSYFWDFGDTQTSIAANPVHNFPGSSTYQVTLRVTSSEGGVNSITKNVDIGSVYAYCECIDDSNGNIIWSDSFSGTAQQVAAWKAALPGCGYTLNCN